MNLKQLSVFAALAALLTLPGASQSLTLSDNFNTSDPSQSANVNFDLESRQSGSAATTSWVLGGTSLGYVNPATLPGKLVLKATNGFGIYGHSEIISPTHDFTEFASFAIDFDMDLGAEGSSTLARTTDWVAVIFGGTIGAEAGDACTVNGAHGGVGMLFDRDGSSFQLFDNGVGRGAGSVVPAGTWSNCHIRIEVTAASWGSDAEVKLLVNGDQVVIPPSWPGVTPSGTYLRSGGFANNRITLQNVTYRWNAGDPSGWVADAFDNFVVQELITASPTLTIERWTGNQARLSWPAAATGFTLQRSAAVSSGYATPGLTITTEGAESVAYDTLGTGARFYRLVK